MSKKFTAYAPPMMWGAWNNIQAHGGSINFKITYSPIGDALVMGKVRYFKSDGNQIEQEFKDEISIKTANVWATIEVCFKGLTTGSTVEGEIL